MVKQKEQCVLFTIGYQGRTLERVLDILLSHRITLVIDVRESPRSRYRGLSKKPLTKALNEIGIDYRWMGTSLGSQTCSHELWLQGCRIVSTFAKWQHVAILCLERDPRHCHRSQIARLLQKEHGFRIQHL